MSDRRSRLPLLMLIIASQMMLLTSTRRYYGGLGFSDQADITREVMTKHYRLCPIQWADEFGDATITCVDSSFADARVYQSYDTKKWVAFGWGLHGGDRFETKQAAKESIELEIRKWLPKPPLPAMHTSSYWKFWRSGT